MKHIPTLGQYLRKPKTNVVFHKNEREPTLKLMRKALESDVKPTTTEQLAAMVFKSGSYIRRLMRENIELQIILRQNYKRARAAEMKRIVEIYNSKPEGVLVKDWAAKNNISVPMFYKARDYVRDMEI